MDRRSFLSGSLAAGAAFALRRTADAGAVRGLFGPRREAEPVLVLVELSGGNDGLNTLVPHADDAYHRARRRLAVPAGEVLDLDGTVGLAPQLARLRAEYDEGRVAIVQGCGYPDPNRSHFESMEIWHTARATGRDSGPGWIGHLANELWGEEAEANRLVHVGSRTPYSLHSLRHPAIGLQTPRNYRWAGNEDDLAGLGGEPAVDVPADESQVDFLRRVMRQAESSSLEVRRAVARYRPAVEYPREPLAQSLAVCAALLDARLGCRVLSVQQGGYDTHAGQATAHQVLLAQLDAALDAFVRDLRAKENDAPVCALVFSEFGRRVEENASAGTDHGTAGPTIVLGSGVQGGLYGEHPSLSELDERGDLAFTTDFRRVYATLVERHFGADPQRVLGDRYLGLDLLPRRR